jgi:membrane protein implicated in regulation of membrane protease activity
MPTWTRYLLFQIPGWIVAALVLWLARQWEIISLPIALMFFCLLILKDWIVYPWVSSAYEESGPLGSKALIGSRGVAESDVAPVGFIRVRGELWQAVAVPPDRWISAGSKVEIADAEGMKVFVRRIIIDD